MKIPAPTRADARRPAPTRADARPIRHERAQTRAPSATNERRRARRPARTRERAAGGPTTRSGPPDARLHHVQELADLDAPAGRQDRTHLRRLDRLVDRVDLDDR